MARRVNARRRQPGAEVWQRGYWKRVVRDDAELHAIRRYIAANPRRWAEDRENLDAVLARMDRHDQWERGSDSVMGRVARYAV